MGVFWAFFQGFTVIFPAKSVIDVFFFNASLSALAPSAPIQLSACWCLLLPMSATHPSSLLPSCSPNRFSDWSVVLVFNASLSALAPSAPILLSACWCLVLAMSEIRPSSVSFFLLALQIQCCECCVCFQCFAQCFCSFSSNAVACSLVLIVGNVRNSSIFLAFFCSLARFSEWSVVFVFNASLSAFDPSALILFPACLVFVAGNVCNSSIFHTFFLITTQNQSCQCCVCLQCLAQ